MRKNITNLEKLVYRFSVDSGIDIKYISLVEKIYYALCKSCNVGYEDIYAQMDIFDFSSCIKTLDGWDDFRFLICLEDILHRQFSDEEQNNFPTLFYDNSSKSNIKKTLQRSVNGLIH